MKGNRLLADSAITALAPVIWGSTYLVTTQLLPPDRPLKDMSTPGVSAR